MIENTNTKQFYPGPILNNTLEITDFLFNDAEQIKIKHSKLNEEGALIDIDLAYPIDYEVTKILPSDINAAEAALTASTGQVLLKNVNVLAGEKLTVYRVSQIIQDKDYPRTGAFPAASHEGALDYLTMQNQEQQEQINRALKIPNSVETFDAQMPTPLPARALKINADGTGFEMSEFDPDVALITTEEFKNQAQQAAIKALTSQNVAAEQANIATEQANIATQQATIATNKASEVIESGNEALSSIDTTKDNAITSITTQETTSKNVLIDEGATQVGLIQNEGATQIANVQSTGFYMRDDKLYFINSQGEETEFKSGGSGREICDIGTALYIDETKGLRRRLNGSIMDITSNYQAFLTRLLEIKTTNPNYFTDEETWQTEATLNVDGCVYKFVLNYDSTGTNVVSVRLPKYPDYVEINNNSINNTAPVSVYGDGKAIGTNFGVVLGDRGGAEGISLTNQKNGAKAGVGCEWSSGRYKTLGVTTDPSTSGLTGTAIITSNFRQTKLKLRYFIQIATGSETENNIINEIELNNPYSLFDSKYSEYALNNLSWLPSFGQWNSGTVYVGAYQKLLRIYNETEEPNGMSVKLVTPPSYTVTATSGWSNPSNAYDGNLETYASCGTGSDYVEFTYSSPVTIKGFKAICQYVSSIARACNVALFSVDAKGVETLIANGTGASRSDTYTTGANFSEISVSKLRFKLINSTEGSKPTTEFPTRIREFVVDIVNNEYTDYDFVLNTADETFRLPLKTNLASGKAVVGNGMTLGLMESPSLLGGLGAMSDGSLQVATGNYGVPVDTANSGTVLVRKTLGVVTDPTKSGIETSDSGLYLYFYVGETVQNANLINAGRIGEQLATKTDMLQASGAGMPSNKYIDLTLGASGSTYIAPANGWLTLSKACSANEQYIQLGSFGGVSAFCWSGSSYNACVAHIPVKKGQSVDVYYTAGGSVTDFRFYYAEGSK